MDNKHKFIKILQDNNDILEEFFDKPKSFFFKPKNKITSSMAKQAILDIQSAIKEFIVYNKEDDRFYIDDIKFGFILDENNNDTNILFDINGEFNETIQLISFELDKIFPKQLQGNWLITTYKIVISDDTITLYNHNENFSYELLLDIFNKDIINMSLEEVTILQYVLSWIAIIVEFTDTNTSRDEFIKILQFHEYDDVNFYNEIEFKEAVNNIFKD